MLYKTRVQPFAMAGDDYINRILLQFPDSVRPILHVCIGGVTQPVQTNDHAASKEQFAFREIDSHFIWCLGRPGVNYLQFFAAIGQGQAIGNRKNVVGREILHL